jgi:hypothetical protein
MSRKVIITESQFDYWKEQNQIPSFFGKRAYHVVGGKYASNAIDAARSIYHKGLVPSDNGEVGNVTWFFVGKPFYNDYILMFSIDITPENYEKYEMSVDEPNMWARNTIPFSDLKVECAPMLLLNSGHILENRINSFMTECFANSFRNCDADVKPVTIFTDVAPKELVDQLDQNSPDIILDKLFR